MNLKTFKKISAQISQLEKNDIKFDIAIRGDTDWQCGSETAFFEPTHYEVSTLKQLSDVQAVLGKPIKLNDSSNKITIKDLTPTLCVARLPTLVDGFKNKPGEKLNYPTLKFYTSVAREQIGYGFDISMIHTSPTEQEEDGVTYRYIGDKTQCLFCIPHTHSLYNYLDKGFFFMQITRHNEKEKLVITNELTLDTFLALVLIHLQPSYTKQLTDGCFLNANQAKLLRIKFEKDLKDGKIAYERVKAAALIDWEKAANQDIIRKLSEGKVAHTTYNHIKLTRTTATYETVSIESEDLIKVIQNHIIFDDRTDIYTIIQGYINFLVKELEAEDIKAAADAKTKIVQYNVVINGIKITLSRTSENTRRYINGTTINMSELEAVVFRASCFDSQDSFDKFVAAVHKMSLKWHDVLANGLAVKIHDGMSNQDYKTTTAPLSAPRIKFKKVDKDYHLIINDEKSVKIGFNKIQQAVYTLNRKTNNLYIPGGYTRRTAEWARVQLREILKECCTFETTTKVLDEKGKQIIDVSVTPAIKDKDGNIVAPELTIKTPRVLVEKVCTISDEDAKVIETMARDYQKKAIEKSKLALDLALKRTGAKLITFKGEEGYLVEGTLRKYVVNAKTNQVYNYDKGNYICIVEAGHQINVGFDALASRLYALKNDSVMVKHVGTLSHG